ncbi:MAG: GTP-binding protein [Gammaproteobacteria bacterium]|nr:GTP-binding protein [Gammaproteobacteria bacterium]
MGSTTKKVCIIGDFAVGKTSTVARCVHNVFSEKYLTTVGVKIDTTQITMEESGETLKMVIWDIAGTDRFSAVEFSYLRGASGYILVVDGTRMHTLEVARRLCEEAGERYGNLPYVTLINKSDLRDSWEVSDADLGKLEEDGYNPIITSAKTGENVSEALLRLAHLVME